MRRAVATAVLACALIAATTASAGATTPTWLAGSCVDIEHAGRFYLKPTGLGTFLLYAPDGKLLAVADGAVTHTTSPGPAAEWAIRTSRGGGFSLRSTPSRQLLEAAGETLVIGVSSDSPQSTGASFRVAKATGCRSFPEAEVNASGVPFRGTRRDGTVRGIADAHMHLMAEFRAGGRVIYGENFDRFGIAEALGHDTSDHGPDGVLDITGNLLRSGVPVGTHDTAGWPGFTGWPTFDTITHQQIYYRWLQRAWMGGLRLITVQTVEDQSLCAIEPLRSHSCDERATVELEVHRLRQLQDYVDAQSGGRGRGWLQIVEDPRAARAAIKQGKLAVVIGIEWSDPFGCSEFRGTPQCTRADIDGGIRRLRAIGVRGIFLAHWVDNALAGAALESGTKGIFIGALNDVQTGGFFPTSACPEAGQGEVPVPAVPAVLSPLFGPLASLSPEPLPIYPAGPQCNSLGLTSLGAYAVNRLMDNHMIIEADHLSERARLQVLAIAEARHYPLVSSHTGTGGFWTASDLERLAAIGGFATATLDEPAALAGKVLAIQRSGGGGAFGVGLGTDTGGFNELPGPDRSPGHKALAYPFRSLDGRVLFQRQRSGQRTFDINKDGMAHYGLMPDLLAGVEQQPGGPQATSVLLRSAEAYLRSWARTGG